MLIKFKSPVFLLLAVFFYSCESQEPASPMADMPETGLKVSEAQMQLANIRIEYVTSGVISRRLLLSGVLKVDEQSVTSISSRVSGRIQNLHFKNTGEMIEAGDPLYDFYSEELLELAREYQSVHDNNWVSNQRPNLEIDAENRLLLQGLLPSQIERLNDTRYIHPVFTIYSPSRGLIRSINVSEGEYVETGQNLFELADDSRLWVEAQVYPNELQLLNPGMTDDVIIPSAGDMRIPNRISVINPAFEPGTNITIVRTIIDNPGKQLRPGMLALLRINVEKSYGLVIPSSALLINSKGYHIWVQQEDGSFASRDITIGIKSADSVLVLSGLAEYEGVVVSGAYLLNSENILKNDYSTSTNK